MSTTYELDKKYSVSYLVCAIHWSPEFMKQVFPRFLRPTPPFALSRDKTWVYSSESSLSLSAFVGQRFSW